MSTTTFIIMCASYFAIFCVASRASKLTTWHPKTYQEYTKYIFKYLYTIDKTSVNHIYTYFFAYLHNTFKFCLPKFQIKERYQEFQVQPHNYLCGSCGFTGNYKNVYKWTLFKWMDGIVLVNISFLHMSLPFTGRLCLSSNLSVVAGKSNYTFFILEI